MSSKVFDRLSHASQGTRSFYEQLRSRDDDNDGSDGEDMERQTGTNVDEENLRHALNDFNPEDLGGTDSRITIGSAAFPQRERTGPDSPSARWKSHDEDIDNDVPASLLVENNEPEHATPNKSRRNNGRRSRRQQQHHAPSANPYEPRTQAQWASATAQQPLHNGGFDTLPTARHPRSIVGGRTPAGPKEKAMWRWVNTSNLDSFMRDVYDYYDGGGLWCILCSNALWLV